MSWRRHAMPGAQRDSPRSLSADTEARWPDRHDRRAGQIGWDVTEDVSAGVYAWLIRAPSRRGHLPWLIRASSRHDGARHHARAGTYHAREGAAALREPFRAPTLLLAR